MKYTASLVKLHIDERICARRKEALERGIPVADDETLNFLLLMLRAVKPMKILEIGTAVGLFTNIINIVLLFGANKVVELINKVEG